MKILLIPGHLNVVFNSITSLHGNTGTAGELEINKRITDRVASMLRDRGFEVVQSDANANDDPVIHKTDFNLALALHCDQDTLNDQGGGMCGSGDVSVDDMWKESLRIKKVFDSIYFKEAGIVNKNFVTEGMAKYYIWKTLTSKTPCVLLEMGQAKDPHDSVLLGNTELIASAIVRSICSALNVTYDLTPPVVTPSELELLKKLNSNLTKEIEALKVSQKDMAERITILESENKANNDLILGYQSTITTANKEKTNLIQQLEAMTSETKKYKNWYETALTTQINKYTGIQLIQMGLKKLLIKK